VEGFVESQVPHSFDGDGKALAGPEVRLLGQHFANFSKVVRVKHVSEISATRVGMWPGEGSARAAYRKMGHAFGKLTAYGVDWDN
jgi:hypothetical protein